jgi:hypothetical protein
MEANSKIDQIFKDAAQDFAPTAPAAVWNKVESSMATASFYRRLGMGIAASVLLIALSVYFVFDINENTKSKPIVTHLQSAQEAPLSSSNAKEVAPIAAENKSQSVAESPTQAKPQPKEELKSNPTRVNQSIAAEKETEAMPNEVIPNPKASENLQAESTALIATAVAVPSVASQPSISNQRIEENSKESETLNQNPTSSLIEEAVVVLALPSIPSSVSQDNWGKPFSKMTAPLGNKILFNIQPIFVPQLSIEAYAGFALSGSNYVFPSTITVDDMAVNGPERSGNSAVFGLDLSYQFLPKWTAYLGLEGADYNFYSNITLPYNPTFVNTEQFGYGALGFFSVYNIQTAMRIRNYNKINYLTQLQTSHSQLRTVAIPFVVGYQFNLKHIEIEPQMGFNYTFIVDQGIEIGDEQGYYLKGEFSDLKTGFYGLSGGLQINYTLSMRWKLGLRTRLNYSLTDISEHPDFNFHPGMTQLNLVGVYQL